MDYEVFLVSRMREEWDAGRSNEDAVSYGLAVKTRRIVTKRYRVMFAAFMGFVAGSILGLQQFGFGLAMAILIDTIVRALLLPSAMKLFGRWNWWLPHECRAGVSRQALAIRPPCARDRQALSR